MGSRVCLVAALLASIVIGGFGPQPAEAQGKPSPAPSTALVQPALAARGFQLAAAGQPTARIQPKKGGTLKVGIMQELAQLDPSISGGRDTTIVALHIWEWLFTLDGKLNIVPMLADSYSISADNTEYTIRLRKGVPFHNGKELKAQDVVASLTRWGALSAQTGKPTFRNVSSVQAKDHYTVIIRLKQPSAALVPMLAITTAGPVIMPEDIAEKYKNQPIKEFIGTGPYSLKEWIPNRQVHLIRFDRYSARSEAPSGYAGRRTAFLNDIVITAVTEDATRVAGIEAGDYDLADPLPGDEFDRISKKPNLRTIIWRPPSTEARTILNTKMGPMSDIRMRRAVKFAVPPEPVMQATGAIWGLSSSLLRPGVAYHSEAGKDVYLSYDPEKAKTLVKEAGYKGEALRFLTTKATPYYYTTAVVIADYLKKVGVNTKITVSDWATYLKIRDSQPDAWDLIGSGATYTPDPAQLTQVQNTGHSGHWSNPRREELFIKMNSFPDYERRFKVWEELQALYWEDLPSIKWGNISHYRALSKNVRSEGDSLEQIFLVLWNTWKD